MEFISKGWTIWLSILGWFAADNSSKFANFLRESFEISLFGLEYVKNFALTFHHQLSLMIGKPFTVMEHAQTWMMRKFTFVSIMIMFRLMKFFLMKQGNVDSLLIQLMNFLKYTEAIKHTQELILQRQRVSWCGSIRYHTYIKLLSNESLRPLIFY